MQNWKKQSPSTTIFITRWIFGEDMHWHELADVTIGAYFVLEIRMIVL